MKTNAKPSITKATDDRDRLALLWKAFEEAELRIAELEAELDRRRTTPAASAVHASTQETVEVQSTKTTRESEAQRTAAAQRAELETIARAEAEASEAHRELAQLKAKIGTLETRLVEADKARNHEQLRAQRALQQHDLARAAHQRDQRLLLDAQEKIVTIAHTLRDTLQDATHVQERNDALVRELRELEIEYASAMNALRRADLKIAHEQGELEALYVLHESAQGKIKDLADMLAEANHLRAREAALQTDLDGMRQRYEDVRADLRVSQEELAAAREELRRVERDRVLAASQVVDLHIAHDATLREVRETREALARAAWERDAANMLYAGAETECAQLADRLGALEAWAVTPRESTILMVQAPPMPKVARFYPLDTNCVSEIHGIHDHEVAALRSVGINMADALLYANLATLHNATSIGLPRLAKLRSVAELMAIRGIGPEWAECFWRGGMRTIDDLARLGAEGIETLLLAHSRANLDKGGFKLAERTVPARAKAIFAECQRHATR